MCWRTLRKWLSWSMLASALSGPLAASAQDLLLSKDRPAAPVSWSGYEAASARVYDDFELEVSGRLERASVWLFSVFPGAWTGALDYELRLDAGGAPGGIVASGTGQNLATASWILVETLDSSTLCSGDAVSCGCDLPATLACGYAWEVEFELQTPYDLAEETPYWLGVHAAADFLDRRLFWLSTLPDDGNAVACEPGGTGGPGGPCELLSGIVHDALAFALRGVPASTADDSVRASFLHVTRASNVSGHVTTLDHPAINDDPDAVVFATQNWAGGTPGASGVYNPHPLGIYYISGSGRWALFNQDFAAMPEDVVFNVLVPQTSPRVQVVSADAAGGSVADLPAATSFGELDAPWLVTQNWNPPGQPAVYNARTVALAYNGDAVETWSIVNTDASAVPANASFNVYQAPWERAFVHVATAGNTGGHITTLSDPRLDGRPHVLIQVAALADPGTPALDAPLGVWYAGSSWTIFAEDFAPIPLGTRFAVYVPSEQSASLAQSIPAGDNFGNFAVVDFAFSNDREDALALVTQSRSAPGATTSVDAPLGTFASNVGPGLALFHEDLTQVQTGTGIHAYLPPLDTGTIVHVARAATLSGSASAIEHPRLDGQPAALPLLTQIWNPHDQGGAGVFNPHPVAVGYASGTWFATNADAAAIPEDAAFVVRVPDAADTVFFHETTPGNVSGDGTWLSDPSLDGDPAARPVVTQTLSAPDESFLVASASPHLVVYDTGAGQWWIERTDGGAMPVGAGFHVLVPGAPCDADHDGVDDALDLCPFHAAPDNASDADGNGIGDSCECGDQTGDGTVNLFDLFAVNDVILGVIPESPLCDTNDDGACNLLDLFGVNDKILGAPAYCERWPAP